MTRSQAILATLLIAATPLAAQSPAAKPTPTIPALFLSDIHLDPYADPAKVAKLNAASATEWAAILAAPPSPTQKQDSAALQATCPVRGIDTPNVLWQSSLRAIHTEAATAKFVTISGDLLAHAFDCKYKTLLPAATHADYVAFVEKTIRYEITGLRATLPGIPIYTALGNNDSGCTDYALAATQDEFLGLTAKIVAEALPEPDRAAVLSDFTDGGNYNVPLTAVPNTRLIVLDNLFLSAKYVTCSGVPDPAPAAAQLAWLDAQLVTARLHHQHVWVMGHIPPGVDLYATARKFTDVCGGAQPQMFLGSERLAETLAANDDIVSLALFGHTHSDEMRLIAPEPSNPMASIPGVPLKITASITPVNGNRPTFTLASIDPATATLTDYTVFMASNLTGIATIWSKEYTYSTTFHEPAFNGTSLSKLIADFQADPSAKSPASQAYVRNYFPGDISQIIQVAWPQYACSLNHDSAQSFAACTCPAKK